MTQDEQAALDALAKMVSMDRPCPAVLPLYAPALELLAQAWRRDCRCLMCHELGTRHPCACAHNQVRKWARKRGMWPLDSQAA